MTNMVNKPSHYIGVNGMEVEEVLQNFLPKINDGYVAHRIGSAVEYLLRAYSKNELEDIEKARQNLEQIVNYERRKLALEKEISVDYGNNASENELNSFMRSLSEMPKQDKWVNHLVPGMKVSTYYAGTNPLD